MRNCRRPAIYHPGLISLRSDAVIKYLPSGYNGALLWHCFVAAVSPVDECTSYIINKSNDTDSRWKETKSRQKEEENESSTTTTRNYKGEIGGNERLHASRKRARLKEIEYFGKITC